MAGEVRARMVEGAIALLASRGLEGTSFSDVLWNLRLLKARDWLVSDPFQEYPIHKIACMSGFKSAAHFSRMFKSSYGASPKAYRAGQGGAEADDPVLRERLGMSAN